MQVQDRAPTSAYQRTQHSQQQFKRTNVQYIRLYTFTTTTFHTITDCSPPQASAQNWRGTQLTIQVQNGKRWKLQQRVIAPRRVHLFRRISPPAQHTNWEMVNIILKQSHFLPNNGQPGEGSAPLWSTFQTCLKTGRTST
jgi:hypothetical protein